MAHRAWRARVVLAVVAIVVAIAAGVGVGRMAAQPGRSPQLDISRLDTLVAERRFFELRDALGSVPGESPGTLFHRGVADARFNRTGEAARRLTAFLASAGTGTLNQQIREAYATMADLHRRAHRYGALVDVRRQMLATFAEQLGSADVAAQEDRLRLWEALRNVPPQEVEIGKGADVPLVDAIDIAVVFPAGEVLLNPDTGSGLSVMARSDAERLGLRLIEVPVGVTTVTGSRQATLAVAPEMRIGDVRIRHAVFLVFPDAALFRARQGVQRHGTIGAPVLEALGDITFTRSGRFRVAAAARTFEGADMFLEDLDPIVDVGYAGRRLRMALDTGADETTFWAKFAHDLDASRLPGAQRVEREVGSIGVTRRVAMLEVPGMAIAIGPTRLSFPNRRLVALDAPTEDGQLFHGSLGRDVYRLHDQLTINYRTMRVALGGP